MLRLFIDFDGTITRQDVGDAFFERFGGQRSVAAVEAYREGRLSAADCFREECAACGEVDKAELDAFLDAQEIDPTFADLVRFAAQRGFPLAILSDGMDYYIRRILERHGLSGVTSYSNTLHLDPTVAGAHGVTFRPEFPYRDEVCDRCACCKRNHILTLTPEDDLVVYIGEGYSDRCPARYADAVFAKDDLLTYCQKENISFYEYQTFADIVRRLESALAAPAGSPQAIRRRRQAAQARCDVYLGG
jgi:2,3-diketo-5-methylthio-1-phosphopentane phosphatase